MAYKPPHLPDHYAAGESQKSMIYSYLLFLWYVRLDRTGVHFIVCQAAIWYTPDFHWWKAVFPPVEIYSPLMSAPLRHQTT